MRYTLKLLLSILFFSTYQLVNCQEAYNYQLRLAEDLEVDSLVLVIYNFHDDEALDWEIPFEYQKVKLDQNERNEYVGQGKLPCQLASGQLRIFSKNQYTALQFIVNSGLNRAFLEDINYGDARLTIQKYLKFDDPAHAPNLLNNALIQLDGDFYDKFGVVDPEYPTVKTLPESARNLLKIEKVNLLKANPDAAVSLLKLFEIFNAHVSDSDYILYSDAFNSLSTELQNTTLGKQFGERLALKLKTYKQLSAGSIVPELIGYTESDSLFTNVKFNRPHILAFGATWCIPCKQNLPRLIRLKKELGIEIIYVNLDDDKDRWKTLIKENSLDWINVTDDKKITKSKIAKDFNVYLLPKYFVVNSHGKIIYSPDALEETDDYMEQLESLIGDALKKNSI